MIPSSPIPSWLNTSILVSSSFSTLQVAFSSSFTSSSFTITGGVNLGRFPLLVVEAEQEEVAEVAPLSLPV